MTELDASPLGVNEPCDDCGINTIKRLSAEVANLSGEDVLKATVALGEMATAQTAVCQGCERVRMIVKHHDASAAKHDPKPVVVQSDPVPEVQKMQAPKVEPEPSVTNIVEQPSHSELHEVPVVVSGDQGESNDGSTEFLGYKGDYAVCLRYMSEHAGAPIKPAEIAKIIEERNPGISKHALQQRRAVMMQRFKEDPSLHDNLVVTGQKGTTTYFWRDNGAVSVATPEVDSDFAELEIQDEVYDLTDWDLKIHYFDGGEPIFTINGHDIQLRGNPAVVLRTLANHPKGATTHQLFQEIRTYDDTFRYEKVEGGLTHLAREFGRYGHGDKIVHDNPAKMSDRVYTLVGVPDDETPKEEPSFLVQAVS